MTLSIDRESPPLRVDETGAIRVGDSRVSIDLVIAAYLSGETPETIAENFTSVQSMGGARGHRLLPPPS